MGPIASIGCDSNMQSIASFLETNLLYKFSAVSSESRFSWEVYLYSNKIVTQDSGYLLKKENNVM